MRKRSGLVLLAVVVLAIFGYLSRPTQAQSQGSGSLAEVAAEIRQLRAVVEENGKQQLLASMLATQQSRIQPINIQLFETRKELEEAVRSVRSANLALQEAQDASGAAASSFLATAKNMHRQASEKEGFLRSRESDLLQALQREEGAWSELMAQLQRSIRR